MYILWSCNCCIVVGIFWLDWLTEKLWLLYLMSKVVVFASGSQSKWLSPRSPCHVNTIVLEDCLSVGDALREIDRQVRNLYIPLYSGVQSNFFITVCSNVQITREWRFCAKFVIMICTSCFDFVAEYWHTAIYRIIYNTLFQPFHSQEQSNISNFSCSLTSNIASHSMKKLAFHSLLRWKMIILPILTTSLIHFSLGRLGEIECSFRTWEWMG